MRAEFDDVRGYCFFIGYPRSGHSMIGALLDAHPNAVIADELRAFQHVAVRFDRTRLFYLIAENARDAAVRARAKRELRYAVEAHWQGRHQRIHIIGDNEAEGATLRLLARPWLLNRLRRTVAAPLRVIHVVRNPFDNITTIATRAAQRAVDQGGPPDAPPDLERAAARYRVLTETVVSLKRTLGDAVLESRHEDFVADPRARLASLCAWLGLDPPPDYLEACASTVWQTARKTRHRLPWSDAPIASVERLIEETPHLRGYRFDS